MGQEFLTRILITALFIIFLLILYVTFFSEFLKPTCRNNQEYAMADLVNTALGIQNPTTSIIKSLTVQTECVNQIKIFRTSYEINYKDGENFFSKELPINIDFRSVPGCENAGILQCILPDKSGKTSYKIEIGARNLKFISSTDK